MKKLLSVILLSVLFLACGKTEKEAKFYSVEEKRKILEEITSTKNDTLKEEVKANLKLLKEQADNGDEKADREYREWEAGALVTGAEIF